MLKYNFLYIKIGFFLFIAAFKSICRNSVRERQCVCIDFFYGVSDFDFVFPLFIVRSFCVVAFPVTVKNFIIRRNITNTAVIVRILYYMEKFVFTVNGRNIGFNNCNEVCLSIQIRIIRHAFNLASCFRFQIHIQPVFKSCSAVVPGFKLADCCTFSVCLRFFLLFFL